MLCRKFLCRLHRLAHHDSGRDDCDVCISAVSLCPLSESCRLSYADFFCCFFRIESRNRRASESHICRTLKSRRLPDEFRCARAVGWVDYRHSRNRSHQGNILKSLMTRAVFAYRDSRVGRANFHICMRVSDGVSDNFKSSSRRKHRKSAGAYDFSRESQTACRRIEVLLCDSHVEKSVRVCLRKIRRHRGF